MLHGASLHEAQASGLLSGYKHALFVCVCVCVCVRVSSFIFLSTWVVG